LVEFIDTDLTDTEGYPHCKCNGNLLYLNSNTYWGAVSKLQSKRSMSVQERGPASSLRKKQDRAEH
jgi:hypothetical protein